MSPTGKLPTRAEFLSNLGAASKSINTIPDNENDCPICLEPLTNEEPTKEYHHLLELPCGHYYGNSCIRAWFDGQNTCPQCRQPCFQAPIWYCNDDVRVCLNDDALNLLALRRYAASFLEPDSSDLHSPSWEEQSRLWQDILDVRTNLYLEQRLDIDSTQYVEYTPWPSTILPLDQDTLSNIQRTLDARVLYEKLVHIYEFLVLREISTNQPSVAMHPFGGVIFQTVLFIIKDLDGMDLSALELGAQFTTTFEEDIGPRILKNWRYDQPPKGWEGFVCDLFQAVVMNFAAMGTNEVEA